MKKILFVIDSLGSGGAQNQVTLLAIELKRRGYDVSVFVYYERNFFESRLIDAQIPIEKVFKKDKIGLNVILGLRKLLKKHKYDTVISFMDTPSFYITISKFISGVNSRIVVSHRSKTEINKLSLFRRKIKEWINLRADYIFCNSNHERKTWLNHQPDIKNRIDTIYNIVNFEELDLKIEKRLENQILCVGSPSSHKNGKVVIKALNELIKKGHDFTVTWVGEKANQIKDRRVYIEEMESMIEEYGLKDKWKWKKPTKSIAKLYSTFSLLIHPSKVEGLPNVICEALAFRLPIMASNVLDHPILLNHGDHGFLFDPDSHVDLAEKILEFFGLSTDYVLEQTAKGYDYSVKTFAKETILNQMKQIL